MSTQASKPESRRPAQIIGRYAVYDEIAAGGMATVHLGRLLGPVGFTRTVAIKRLHPNLSKDPEFTAGFLDEARLAARIRHPNVVQTLDVVARSGELFLVMDYVHGESLAMLIHLANKRKETVPLGIIGNLISGMLQGLHAAHEAHSDRGDPLEIVHRDVSPQNVLVGVDGIPRLLDFGIAKAMGRAANTRGAQLKGKIAYMSPEQIIGNPVTRRTDIWGAAIVLWQALTGRKLFHAPNDAETLYQILESKLDPPSRYNKKVSPELDAVVLRGLERDPEDRFTSAHEMVVAFEKTIPVVSQREVAEWVDKIAGETLASRASRVAEIESMSTDVRAPVTDPPPPPITLTQRVDASSDQPSQPAVVQVGKAEASGTNLESSYMTGMADTLPPPEASATGRKRMALWGAVGLGVVLLLSLGSWKIFSGPSKDTTAGSSTATRTGTPASAVEAPGTASTAPETPSASVSAPIASVSASAAVPPISQTDKKNGTNKTGKTSGTSTAGGTTKRGGGIYARE
ncbi:MAG: protein kinase [Deltaproteobacteria bacterium]|nr:protein kinase [Deltaproteobacteria bacterium]